jgi:hypothetical protein
MRPWTRCKDTTVPPNPYTFVTSVKLSDTQFIHHLAVYRSQGDTFVDHITLKPDDCCAYLASHPCLFKRSFCPTLFTVGLWFKHCIFIQRQVFLPQEDDGPKTFFGLAGVGMCRAFGKAG